MDLSADHLYHNAYRLMIRIGRDWQNSWNHLPFLQPRQAYAVDSKADDGLPGKGIWRSYIPGSYPDPQPPHCASSADPETATYNIHSDGIYCDFVYIVQRD